MRMAMVMMLVLCGIVAGCADKKPEQKKSISDELDIYIWQKFLPNEAGYINKKGKNSINGQALLRTAGGDIRTCAGYTVYLYPVTDYTKEAMKAIYHSDESGIDIYHRDSIREPMRHRVRNIDHALESYSKKQTCGTSGEFEFSNLQDGEYFIETDVRWEVPVHYERAYVDGRLITYNNSRFQGGGLMQRIKVSGGEKARVVLTAK